MPKKYSDKEVKKESDLLTLRMLQKEEEELLAELENLLHEEEYQMAEESFYSYFKSAWSYFDPDPFSDNWHIECICEHAQAAYERKIRRLAITIPPRCSKSSILSIAFPTWVWIKNASEKFITASYSEPLATQFSVQSRQLMAHPWYKKRWVGNNKKFTMRSDSNTKTRIDNDKYGYRISTSPGGIGTGVGYTIAIIDDLLNAKNANSKALKEENRTWYKGTLKNRANNPKTDVIIAVAQRLAEDDLLGYLLEEEKEEWFHLNIPMEFERKYTFLSPIGYNDPRQYENEVLDPKRFDDDAIDGQKKDPMKWATLYQQRPAPAGGAIIKDHWLEWYSPQYARQHIKYDYTLLSADLSMTDTESADYTAITVWGRTGTKLYLLDMIRGKLDILGQMDALRKLLSLYPECRAKLVENKANGPAIIKMLQKEFSGILPIEPKDFGGNKEARLAACVSEFASHNIYFPNANECPWVNDVISELLTFPKSKHDDIVDSITQAINWMALNQRIFSVPVNIEQENPYATSSKYQYNEQHPVKEIKTYFDHTDQSSISTYRGINTNRSTLKGIWDS